MQHLFAQDSSSTVNAKITISFDVGDGVKQVKAVITKPGAHGNDEAIKGVEVHFYIKKSFGLLPLEGDFTTTDDNGEASVEFPIDIPGDKSGNVTVIAKVEDDENLGNVEAMKAINWGVPVKAEHLEPTRALWSSGNNAPWPLAITVTGIVVVVWGVIFYIIYQLIAIKKAGKYESEISNKSIYP